MRIGIDISQTAFPDTGVGNYLSNLVIALLAKDKENEYVLFFSSLRGRPADDVVSAIDNNPRARLRSVKIPPTFLNFVWNKLHILPIENLLGEIDFFISSDWAEPPTKKVRKATIIYDLIVFKHPEKTHGRTEFKINKLHLSPNIVSVQKKKLEWVKKESDIVFCISESTRDDVVELLGIDKNKVKVIYPGVI